MSEPFDYADGATGGEPQGPPNVYLPQGVTPPAYDAYADPAAAHGWQDVYDPAGPEGPAVTGGAPYPGTDAAGGDGMGAPPHSPALRRRCGRRSRRARIPRRRRRRRVLR
ncbi:hypothetical protein ACFCXS_01010 [Streptomyces sp. NPDC056373]|uniref:hypothetical protein n=1 Tax=Streptomyces sp. NPDC056373 TaxID=3345798 RepID=UPI0035E05A7B